MPEGHPVAVLDHQPGRQRLAQRRQDLGRRGAPERGQLVGRAPAAENRRPSTDASCSVSLAPADRRAKW
jgi:hypothetical protein